MFGSTAIHDTRAIAWVKRACAIVVSVYLVIGMIAAYRALVQVYRLEVQSPEVLQPGSEVSATPITSGPGANRKHSASVSHKEAQKAQI